ncbi:phage tail protein [Pseudomonas sp. MWU12-2345]|uniref:phage tail protein n=1 Tax=Pseudomonas sp. MWU12-2345 TaxID=2928689 RepID=UPI00200E9AD9|nr:phage tail protein [Pseudomonas sp. MWU12-2345]
MRQQMALGSFIFGLATAFPYERLERSTSGGWVDLDIIASKPKSHQTGQGLEELRMSGKAMRAVGMERLDQLRALANGRAPYPLVDGIGRNWGRWRIDRVSESQSSIIDDGTAMLIEWTLELKEFVNA